MTDSERDVLVSCPDFAGRQVNLTRDVADHVKARHPEVKPFLQHICEVLESPDLVYLRYRVNSYLFYKLGVLRGRLSNTYMVAVVRYNEAREGEVRTVYPTTRPAGGDMLVHISPRRGR